MINCFDCGEHLSIDEMEDGEIRCLECEEKLVMRFKNWQMGIKDPELELLSMTSGLIH